MNPSDHTPIMRVRDLTKTFPVPSSGLDRVRGLPAKSVKALTGVSLDLLRGETLGIVGESGCGKSTLARCLVRLYDADAGTLEYDGEDVLGLRGKQLRNYNRRVQMVFQDPFSSLNPRMTVGQVLHEALSVHQLRSNREIPNRIHELLDLVGLPKDAAERLPHEFSGGQRQRIGIARALSVEPETLIADELVSALDVSVQAQVVNLLLELQERLRLTVMFVAHDLRLVRHISHRVAVMYLGRIVELSSTEKLFTSPEHPYTQALLRAAPDLDPSRKNTLEAVHGELPSPLNPPSGCAFHPRCPKAFERCTIEVPKLEARGLEGHQSACFLYEPSSAT
jgi:oligopeptide transport system ATP-binding protein